ncbi:hypothetical protein COOONC_00620, partial [Cooperia oncophora]
MAGSRSLQLEFSNVHSVATPTKDAAQYSETTQTDDDRASMGEFSTGSQEFDYDDDMLPMDGGGFSDREEPETVKEEPAPVRIPDLSEEEKNQIVASQGFQIFFNYAAKVIKRALAEAENVDIFIDYARGHGEVIASSDRLVLSRVFSDPKWSQNRAVTGIAFSEQHPELVAVSYDYNKDIPSEPPGVVLIWNTKFKK